MTPYAEHAEPRGEPSGEVCAAAESVGPPLAVVGAGLERPDATTAAELTADPVSVESGTDTIKYRLTEQERDALVADLKAEYSSHPDWPKTRYVCLRFRGDSKYANLVRDVVGVVFDETFSNDPKMMETEYKDTTDAWFYGYFDQYGSIKPGVETKPGMKAGTWVDRGKEEPGLETTGGLKALTDVERAKRGEIPEIPDVRGEVIAVDPDLKNWSEMTTIAVLKEYRGRTRGAMASATLLRAVYRDAQTEGIDNMLAIIDQDAEESFCGVLGRFALRDMADGKRFEYMKSENSKFMRWHFPLMPRQVAMHRALSSVEVALLKAPKMLAYKALGRLGVAGFREKAEAATKDVHKQVSMVVASLALRYGKAGIGKYNLLDLDSHIFPYQTHTA